MKPLTEIGKTGEGDRTGVLRALVLAATLAAMPMAAQATGGHRIASGSSGDQTEFDVLPGETMEIDIRFQTEVPAGSFVIGGSGPSCVLVNIIGCYVLNNGNDTKPHIAIVPNTVNACMTTAISSYPRTASDSWDHEELTGQGISHRYRHDVTITVTADSGCPVGAGIVSFTPRIMHGGTVWLEKTYHVNVVSM